MVGCGSKGGESSSDSVETTQEATQAAHGVEVIYKVYGTVKTADIHYYNETEGTTDDRIVITPEGDLIWEKKMIVPHDDWAFLLYIYASNYEDVGELTVEIWVDGELQEQTKSSGEYLMPAADFLLFTDN